VLFPFLGWQVRTGAFGHFSSKTDRFAQGRVRVDRVTHICSITAHLNSQTDFADEIASMSADNATSDDPMCIGIKQ
jgi:hypothetical protein